MRYRSQVTDKARRLSRCLIWIAAALGLWLFASNRWILHWSNPGLKSGTMALLGASLVGASIVGGLRLLATRWLLLPIVTIAVFTAGEGKRLWLRHRYTPSSGAISRGPEARWNHPFTTTDLAVTHLEVAAKIPISRLRVVHLTDLHATSWLDEQYYRRILTLAQEQAPDLVVMTGDFLSRPEYLGVLKKWLATPLSARYGVYAVLGNHEYWIFVEDTVRQMLSEAGYHVISGRCERPIATATGNILLCGTEQPWGPDFLTPERGPDDYVIALSHTPDNVYALHGRANAVFSGHNHGGQFRLPGVGAFVVPSKYGRRFDQGHFDIDGTQLFVSAGVGADFPPVRLWCPPELLVVDFVQDNKQAIQQKAVGLEPQDPLLPRKSSN